MIALLDSALAAAWVVLAYARELILVVAAVLSVILAWRKLRRTG